MYDPTRRTKEPMDEEINEEAIREELNLVGEVQLSAALHGASLKQKITLRYDMKVIKWEFKEGSLVLKRNHKHYQEGKLAVN